MTFAAVGIGLGLGTMAWTLTPSAHPAEAATAQAEALRARSPGAPALAAHGEAPGASASLAAALAAPLFPTRAALAAAAQVQIRLEGVARTPERSAALLSIGEAPSSWLGIGERRDGLQLQAVEADHVVLRTPAGPREVHLASADPIRSSVSPDPAAKLDEIPRGFRMPPPPASAPQAQP